jgi:hypothetical protein
MQEPVWSLAMITAPICLDSANMAASTLTSIVSFDGGVHLAPEEDSRL